MDGAKLAARATARKRRRAAHHPVHARAALQRALSLRDDWRDCRVGLYAGFGDELDPAWLTGELRRRGAVVGLPVVVGKGTPLVFRRFAPDIRHTRSAFGISEPAPSVRTVRPDVVLVPLVAVDRAGVRLGYGGGYYDRTIAAWAAVGHRPLLIGLAFEAQLVPRLPRAGHDRRLDMLVTEAATRRFR